MLRAWPTSGPYLNDPGLKAMDLLIFVPLMSDHVQVYDASLIKREKGDLVTGHVEKVD